MDFRTFRFLVRIVNPGKVPDLPRPGFLVQALGVALLRRLQGTINMNFDKIKPHIPVQFPYPVTVRPVRADKSGQDQQARIHKQFRDLADAADILRPVLRGETQVPVYPHADIVTVQPVAQFPMFVKSRLKRDRNGALAAARQAGKPECRSFLPQQTVPVRAGDVSFMPVNIGRFLFCHVLCPCITVLVERISVKQFNM